VDHAGEELGKAGAFDESARGVESRRVREDDGHRDVAATGVAHRSTAVLGLDGFVCGDAFVVVAVVCVVNLCVREVTVVH